MDTIASLLAKRPDGWPMRWNDITDDAERIGFAPVLRSRYLDVTWYDGNDERRYSIVNLDDEAGVTVVFGAEMDEATEYELVSDVRGRLRYRDDLTLAQQFARAEKIAESLRRSLHGGRAA